MSGATTENIPVKLDTQKSTLADICVLKSNISAEALHLCLCEVIKEYFDGHSEIVDGIVGPVSAVIENLQNGLKQSESFLEQNDSKQTVLRSFLAFSDTHLVQQLSTKSEVLKNALLRPNEINNDTIISKETPEQVKLAMNDARLNFIRSIETDVRKYCSDVKLKLETIFRGQHVITFGHFECKIAVASSDAMLCVAMFKDDKKSVDVEFFNELDKSVHKRTITADHEHFKLFSCSAGIVARFQDDTFCAFRIIDGLVTLSHKWKYTSDVNGFVFDESKNMFTAYNIKGSILKFEGGYSDLSFDSNVSGICISSSINFPKSYLVISWRNEDKSHEVRLYDRVSNCRLPIACRLPDYPPNIKKVKIQQSANNLVAVGFDSLSGQFGLLKLDSELKPLQKTVQLRKFELEKKIRYDVYFNSSAYLVTLDRCILKIPNLLNLQ